ncbi:SPOR domain-containing protein [bacterium]|nr:SPOR domain-containing protein [bacterium]MBU1957374.1 SPOR domain-containing protein [bacterium]
MKYSKGLIISTAALSILATGCVKKTTAETPVVYDNAQPVYESGSPIVYETPGTTGSSGTIYSEVPTDNTVITTTGAYNNPYGTDTAYPDPYANQPIATDYPASSSTGVQGGGIHLQVAALKDYYAAEEFRKGLSLDPKYTSYVQQGAMNKVIVSGISSVSEANQLKATRFPDAFIVSGSATSVSSTGGYTTNTPYGNTAAASGIGVQIGAFSTHERAQNAAQSASSKYAPLVKTGTSNGKTIYKAILTGFSSEQEARSFIAQRGGVGFLVHGL